MVRRVVLAAAVLVAGALAAALPASANHDERGTESTTEHATIQFGKNGPATTPASPQSSDRARRAPEPAGSHEEAVEEAKREAIPHDWYPVD